MSEPRWIIVNGWDKFQHRDAMRRRGTALWHKVYNELLHKDEYVNLTFAQRGILHGLWMMRSTSEDIAIARARALLGAPTTADARYIATHLDALQQAGFITLSASRVASNLASEPASSSASLEEKREEEKEPKAVTEYVDADDDINHIFGPNGPGITTPKLKSIP